MESDIERELFITNPRSNNVFTVLGFQEIATTYYYKKSPSYR
jgi:hypothetical protein